MGWMLYGDAVCDSCGAVRLGHRIATVPYRSCVRRDGITSVAKP